MIEMFKSHPVLFLYAIVILSILAFIALVIVLYSGSSLEFGKFKIGSKKNSPEKETELAKYKRRMRDITDAYKDFKEDTKNEVQKFLEFTFCVFAENFTNALISEGVNSVGIEHCRDTIIYESLLGRSIDTLIYRSTKKSIYKNHFPIKKDDENFKDFRERFHHEYIVGTEEKPGAFDSIYSMSVTTISQNWAVDSISRVKFKEKYLPIATEKAMWLVTDLCLNSQKRRNVIINELINIHPELNAKRIEEYWRSIYR